MLTYRLRERVLEFDTAEGLQYPAEAEVCVALEPVVPFGGVAGETRSVVADAPLRLKINASTGTGAVRTDEPLFPPVEASTEVADTRFVLAHNVATVYSKVSSAEDLADLIAAVFHVFPAVLNVFILDAPFATHAWGRVGSASFRWLFEPTEIIASTKVTSKANQEDLATRSWGLVGRATNSRRLVGALVYFHTGCRLLAAGQNRFEFLAEALLNFAKSLQSLFGESRDHVRAGLAALDMFDAQEIEAKFVPAMVLRSAFDVGHVSLAVLSRSQLRVLHEYTNLAEQAFRTLFERVLAKLEDGTLSLPPDTPGTVSRDGEAALRRLASNIEPYVAR